MSWGPTAVRSPLWGLGQERDSVVGLWEARTAQAYELKGLDRRVLCWAVPAWFLISLRQGRCSEVVTEFHRRSLMREAISSEALKVMSSCLVLLIGRCRQSVLSITCWKRTSGPELFLSKSKHRKSLNYSEFLSKWQNSDKIQKLQGIFIQELKVDNLWKVCIHLLVRKEDSKETNILDNMI